MVSIGNMRRCPLEGCDGIITQLKIWRGCLKRCDLCHTRGVFQIIFKCTGCKMLGHRRCVKLIEKANEAKDDSIYVQLIENWQKANDIKKWTELMNSSDTRTTSVQQSPKTTILDVEESEDNEEWLEIDNEWMENIDDVKETIQEIDETDESDDDAFPISWRQQKAVPKIENQEELNVKYIEDDEESVDENTPMRLQSKLRALTHEVLLGDVWAPLVFEYFKRTNNNATDLGKEHQEE